MSTIPEKMEYYQSQYASAQVNDIKEYTQQTLGSIFHSAKCVPVVIGGIAISLESFLLLIYSIILENCYYQKTCLKCYYAKYRV
ncbi:hypothetical protein LSPH24S_01712 [Lysinibacillus sphaericus]